MLNKESHELFCCFAHHPLPVFVLKTDRDGAIPEMVYANEALTTMMKAPAESLYGKPLSEVFPGNAEADQALVNQAACEGLTGNCVWLAGGKRGQLRYYPADTGYCVCQLEQEPAQVDAGELVHSRTEARESNEQYHKLLEAIPGGIAEYDTDADGNVTLVYFNDEVCRISGFSREEITRVPVEAICRAHPDERQHIEECVSKAIRAGQTTTIDYRMIDKNGVVKYVNLKASVIPRKGTKVSRSYVVYTDIDKNRRTELQFQALVDAVPGGVAVYEVSPDGVEPVFVSEGIVRVSGFTREEFVTLFRQERRKLVHPDDWDALLEEYRQCLNEGHAMEHTYRALCRDGQYR